MGMRIRLNVLKPSNWIYYAAIFSAVMWLFGCAGMGDSVKEVTRDVTDWMGISELPHPIATSLETMPRDAAIVAAAVERQIAGRGNVKVENIIFMQAARTQLTVANLPGEDMAQTAVHLYEYMAFPENPVIKRSRGRILYEGPGGRRASLLFLYAVAANLLSQILELNFGLDHFVFPDALDGRENILF